MRVSGTSLLACAVFFFVVMRDGLMAEVCGLGLDGWMRSFNVVKHVTRVLDCWDC
jgi:hypothetical protein